MHCQTSLMENCTYPCAWRLSASCDQWWENVWLCGKLQLCTHQWNECNCMWSFSAIDIFMHVFSNCNNVNAHESALQSDWPGWYCHTYYNVIEMISVLHTHTHTQVLSKLPFSCYTLCTCRNKMGLSSGQLLLGGRDPSLYVGDLTYVNTAPGRFWQINMDK